MHRNFVIETFFVPLMLFVFFCGSAGVGYFLNVHYGVEAGYSMLAAILAMAALVGMFRERLY